MENIANKECGFEHEIVSYMYDETDAVGRLKFETHLADCGACTDEFAAVSLARFSVFEWQKEEFAHLSTPEIVIPYEMKKAVAESAGWLSGLSEIFAFARSPLAIGATFAVVLGIGFIGFNLMGTGGNEVAINRSVPTVIVAEKVELSNEVQAPVGPDIVDIVVPSEESPVTAASRGSRPKAARQTSPSRRLVEVRSTPNSTRQARRAPVLGDLADDDEDSLRLSAMLDEIGG